MTTDTLADGIWLCERLAPTHAFVIVAAQEIGYYVKDLFILQATSVLYSPNMAHQQHARKTHSYFLVLQKGAPEGKRRRAKVT